MGSQWGGAQWVLATMLVFLTVVPPLVRHYAACAGATLKSSWPEFWGKWFGDLLGRLILVLILAWGGFWT